MGKKTLLECLMDDVNRYLNQLSKKKETKWPPASFENV